MNISIDYDRLQFEVKTRWPQVEHAKLKMAREITGK